MPHFVKQRAVAIYGWTDSPEVSYVLEYNPQTISDEEIIKMAESAEPYEK